MRVLPLLWLSLVLGFTSAHHPTAGGGGGHKGYSLGIRDSIMIAHSFEGSQFGPAQQVCMGLCVGVCACVRVAVCACASVVLRMHMIYVCISIYSIRYSMSNMYPTSSEICARIKCQEIGNTGAHTKYFCTEHGGTAVP